MRHYNWTFIWIVTLVITFNGASLFASEQKTVPKRGKLPTGPGLGGLITKWVDIAHAEVSKRILRTAERFDAFFGDERIEEERQNTQIEVTTSVKLTKDQNPEFTFPISANLALPHLKNKIYLIADTLLRENEEKSEDGDQKEGTDITLSLRYKVFEQLRKCISLDTGAKVNPDSFDLDSIEPFVSARFRGTFDFDPWALSLTQVVFWFDSKGIGENLRLDFERRMRDNTMFLRMTSNATWSKKSKEVEFGQSLLFRWKLSHNRAIGLKLSADGHTRPSTVMEKYAAKFTYRRRIYRKWAFLALEPEIQFLRKDHFKLTPMFMSHLEIRFGKL